MKWGDHYNLRVETNFRVYKFSWSYLCHICLKFSLTRLHLFWFVYKNFTSSNLRISPQTQTYFQLSLGSLENNLPWWNQVTAGNISAFAGYLCMSSLINWVANHNSSGNWLFQSSLSWCWPKDTWVLGTRLTNLLCWIFTCFKVINSTLIN